MPLSEEDKQLLLQMTKQDPRHTAVLETPTGVKFVPVEPADSALGAGYDAFKRSVMPTIAGAVGGGALGAAGAAAGGGPTPLGVGLGIGGTLVGGIGGSVGYNVLRNKLESPETNLAYRAAEELRRKEHPIANALGEVAAGALVARPDPRAIGTLIRGGKSLLAGKALLPIEKQVLQDTALGVGINAPGAAQEAYNGGDVSPSSLAAGAVRMVGAAPAKATVLGKPLMEGTGNFLSRLTKQPVEYNAPPPDLNVKPTDADAEAALAAAQEGWAEGTADKAKRGIVNSQIERNRATQSETLGEKVAARQAFIKQQLEENANLNTEAIKDLQTEAADLQVLAQPEFANLTPEHFDEASGGRIEPEVDRANVTDLQKERMAADAAAKAEEEKVLTPPLPNVKRRDSYRVLRERNPSSFVEGLTPAPESVSPANVEGGTMRTPDVSDVPLADTSVPPGRVPPRREEPAAPPVPTKMSEAYQLVPGSVYHTAAKENPVLEEPLAKFSAMEHSLKGIGYTANDALRRVDQAALASAMEKRNYAYTHETHANLTPEETAAITPFDRFLRRYAGENRAAGRTQGENPNYVPHMIDPHTIGKMVKSQEVWDANVKAMLDFNREIQGSSFNEDEALKYINKYLLGLTQGQGVGPFNALTKDARPYYLPDSMRDKNPMRLVERYNERAGRDIARTVAIEANPNAKAAMGIRGEGEDLDNVRISPAVANARDAVYGQISVPPVHNRTAWEGFRAVQNLANASIIQTGTGVRNILQGLKEPMRHLRDVRELEPIIEGTLRPLADYHAIRERLVAEGAYNPARGTQTLPEDADFHSKLAENLYRASNFMRTVTGSQKLEEIARVKDFSIGESLAKFHLARAGEKNSAAWLKKFGANLDTSRPLPEQVGKLAANYTRDLQSAYNAEDLPAWMLRPGLKSSALRLQKYGIGNFNRVRGSILPALKEGNALPLVSYVLGSALVSGPAVLAFNKMLSGVSSSTPTFKEIDAGLKPEEKNRADLEKALSIMEMADAASFLGIVGSTAGRLSANVRGKAQAIVSEPVSDILVNNVLLNGGRMLAAMQQGGDKEDILIEGLKTAILNTVQDARIFKRLNTSDADLQQREDTRNKKVYSYLSGEDRPDALDIAKNALGRREAPGYTLIQENRVLKGETSDERLLAMRKLLQQKTPVEIHRGLELANNYPGVYAENTRNVIKNNGLMQFLEATQGPNAKAALLQRKTDFDRKSAENVRGSLPPGR